MRVTTHGCSLEKGHIMGRDITLTFIAAGTTIHGELLSEDDLTIEGRVEGSVTARGLVTITETAEVIADITAADVVVLGSLEGDVIAAGTVEIASSGRVEGDIKAARVMLSEGAVFRGSIDMGGNEDRGRKPAAHRAATRSPAVPEPSRSRSSVERSPERPAGFERSRRPASLPPSMTHSSAPVAVTRPAKPIQPEPETPVLLRAPDPHVRGVGRTRAFKK